MKRFLFIILAIIIFGCSVNDKNTYVDESYCKYKYLEKGKSIGRNAMLIYINELDLIDTIHIELIRLLALEDSLQKVKMNE